MPRVSGPTFRSALTLTCTSMFVAMVAYAAPLGNIATLAEVLPASASGRTWILASMSLGLAVVLLTAGALADLVGRRRVFVLGAWVFAAGSGLCAVAPGTPVFVLGRVVEGAGGAGLIATGLGLVALVTSGEGRQTPGTAGSWWGASLGLGIAVGPLLSGALDLVDGWRVPYVALAVGGVATALAAPRCFAETPRVRGRRLDLAGAALLTLGTAAAMVALVEVRAGGAGAVVVAGVVAVAALAGFVVAQRRGRHPMLPPELFGRPDFVAATLAAVATGLGVIALMSFSGGFMVGGLGLSTWSAALVLAAWSLTSAVSAAAVRPLVAGWDGGTQLVVGLTGTAAGLALLSGLGPDDGAARLLPGMLLAGLATGVLNGGLGRQAPSTVPPERAALGTGVNNTARYLAASAGVTIVGLVAATPDATASAQLSGWNHAALLTAGLTALGALTVAVLGRRARVTV